VAGLTLRGMIEFIWREFRRPYWWWLFEIYYPVLRPRTWAQMEKDRDEAERQLLRIVEWQDKVEGKAEGTPVETDDNKGHDAELL
jgi:hypothetical protein